MAEPAAAPGPAPEPAPAPGLAGRHGRAVVELAIVSGLGILATAGLQIVASRGLGPDAFGLLAAFLSLINIAAIGSAALRNSVAVSVAETDGDAPRRDGSLVEAVVLGTLVAVALLVLSPWLAGALESQPVALGLTAAAIAPSFLFARSLGLLQGRGDARAVVWWSTGAQLAQLVAVVLVILAGLGVAGVLAVSVGTILATTVGAGIQTRGMRSGQRRAFPPDALVVIGLTIGFAWLTSIDVVLVRATVDESAAGAYAAAAVLVKTTLILPATLSLYLLPRFVRSRGDRDLTRRGVNVTLVATLASGLLIAGILVVAGGWIVALLFGDDYAGAVGVLPLLAVSWIPWALTQAILVRVTAIRSRAGLAVVAVAVVGQLIAMTAALPDLLAAVSINGGIGMLVFAALLVIHLRSNRPTSAAPTG